MERETKFFETEGDMREYVTDNPTKAVVIAGGPDVGLAAFMAGDEFRIFVVDGDESGFAPPQGDDVEIGLDATIVPKDEFLK